MYSFEGRHLLEQPMRNLIGLKNRLLLFKFKCAAHSIGLEDNMRKSVYNENEASLEFLRARCEYAALA